MTGSTNLRLISLFLITSAPTDAAEPTGPELRQEALQTLKTAAATFREKAASHGGYVYYHTPDFKERWGEGKASPDTIFVQPPGTPTVGMAYLKAFAATGDRFYLDAAKETAESLVYGQLQSGGWTQTIEFGAAKRTGKYRNGKGGSWNASSLDDGQTQSALQFLARADQALEFKHAAIHEAARYGFKALLAAQFRNGAFPQVWTKPVEDRPVVKAKFPADDWKTEGKIKNYWDQYTLNDNLAGTVAETLLVAHEVYKDEQYLAALRKLGDFLILAQMPDPQPGWCQQYNAEMVPIWARKFEPPAISGWESQDAMDTLIRIARVTGEKKYLEPIPKALEYFNKRLLPDGKIARYYELKTDKPLYMDSAYRLTYEDTDVPAHYGWKQSARFKEIERRAEAAKAGRDIVTPKPTTVKQEADIRRVVRELDAGGLWVTTYAGEHLVGQPKFADGFKYVSSAVFARNVETLAAYIASAGK